MMGPSLGGVLVQVLAAPLAILAGSVSGVVSVFLIRSIQATEPEPAPKDEQTGMIHEIRAGLRFVLGHPILRPIVVSTAIFILGFGMHVTLFILFLSRELGLSPALIGLIFASSGPGFLIGALIAGGMAERFGIGPVLIGSQVLAAGPMLLIPFVTGPSLTAVPLLSGASLLSAIGGQISGITALSLRQYLTPDRMLGRTNATMRFVSWSGAPLAALFAGWAAEMVGLRLSLLIAAVFMLLSVLPLVLTAIRTLRVLSEEPETLAI
jgi:MFS family permease